MTPQERAELLDRLNNRLADKTLSFGCRVKIKHPSEDPSYPEGNDGSEELCEVLRMRNDEFLEYDCLEFDKFDIQDGVEDYTFEVIGHPVNIGRVLAEMKNDKDGYIVPILGAVAKMWDCEHDILEAQSDECLGYLGELFLGTKE